LSRRFHLHFIAIKPLPKFPEAQAISSRDFPVGLKVILILQIVLLFSHILFRYSIVPELLLFLLQIEEFPFLSFPVRAVL